ncbi:MAG: hypothetical protein V4819_22865 [Verrucomicrobiota bacterium]
MQPDFPEGCGEDFHRQDAKCAKLKLADNNRTNTLENAFQRPGICNFLGALGVFAVPMIIDRVQVVRAPLGPTVSGKFNRDLAFSV